MIGQGKIPLAPLLRAIHDGGYRGPYAVETFKMCRTRCMMATWREAFGNG